MSPIFRIEAPSQKNLEDFHRDGYVAIPEVFTEEALSGLTDEVLSMDGAREYLHALDDEQGRPSNPTVYFVRPWNNRGPWGDRLIDAPLVTALLQTTIGPDYHFCHSALNIAPRGVGRLSFHQDHHHWRHANPINLAERDKWYIQILYYPNGFTRGDRSLSVIPGEPSGSANGRCYAGKGCWRENLMMLRVVSLQRDA